jgi:hypothetical protein
MRLRQKEIQKGKLLKDLHDHPCNITMEFDDCGRRQKTRAFCYFCNAMPRLPVCGQCGKQKCLSKGGDCLVKHGSNHVTGLGMVGGICDHCEAWICHGSQCLSTHGCECPLRVHWQCIECERTVWQHGGRVFLCAYCGQPLCEDDQFEHQANCQRLDAESEKCAACNRRGQFSCLRCKVAFCDTHVRRKGVKYERGAAIPCPKCGYATAETNELSISTRRYNYGRQTHGDEDDDDNYAGESGAFQYYGASGSRYSDDEDDDDEDDDEDGSDDEDEDEASSNEEDGNTKDKT